MQNKFFGSKLNTVLLLTLIILMFIAIYFMFQNKKIYLPELVNTNQIIKTNFDFEIANRYGYELTIYKNYKDSISINWGGRQSVCAGTDYKAFVYGVSTETCLRGLRAELGWQSPYVLTQEDKNIFGDFVNDNK